MKQLPTNKAVRKPQGGIQMRRYKWVATHFQSFLMTSALKYNTVLPINPYSHMSYEFKILNWSLTDLDTIL